MSTPSLDSPCRKSCNSSIFPSSTSKKCFNSVLRLVCLCLLSSTSVLSVLTFSSRSLFFFSAALKTKETIRGIVKKKDEQHLIGKSNKWQLGCKSWLGLLQTDEEKHIREQVTRASQIRRKANSCREGHRLTGKDALHQILSLGWYLKIQLDLNHALCIYFCHCCCCRIRHCATNYIQNYLRWKISLENIAWGALLDLSVIFLKFHYVWEPREGPGRPHNTSLAAVHSVISPLISSSAYCSPFHARRHMLLLTKTYRNHTARQRTGAI